MRTWPTVTVAAIALAIVAPSSSRSDDKAAAAAGNDKGFVRLFAEPGAPKGWRVTAWDDVANPAPEGAQWRVDEHGVLHGSDPRGTWLVSEQEYGDFELAFEFKLPPQGNSGCGLRFPAKGDPAFDGMELQMADRRYSGDNVVGADELTGALYQAITPRATPFKPEDWNAYHIKCHGPNVYVTLNGEVVIDIDLDDIDRPLKRGMPLNARPRKGHIGFQELSRGGGHVQIRNAKLKVLDGQAAGAGAALERATAVIDVTANADSAVTISINGKRFDQPQLRDVLRNLRDEAAPQGPPAFVLHADDAAPYGEIEKVLIDLAMSRYEAGRIETRRGGSHPFQMPVKTEGEVRPAPVDVRVTDSDGGASVEVRGTTVADLGEPLVRLLAEARTALPADTPAAVSPTADASYAAVSRAYAACQEAGFRNVLFRTSAE